MVSGNGGSWRDQLSKVKDKVAETTRQKELERRLQVQQTKESIAERLATDTPDELDRRFRGIQDALRAGGRELFPVETMLEAAKDLDDLSDRAEFYLDTLEKFGEVFPAPYKELLPKLQASLDELKKRSAKQVEEWSNVKIVTDATKFRGKQAEDDPTLLHIARTFYERAHGIDLNLPKHFFAKKAEGFYVVTFQDIPYAYAEVGDAKGTITIVVGEVIGANFIKLVRGCMYTWCQRGPVAKTDTISVRVTSRDEVKFFKGLNFLRTGTHGMSDWSYSRKVL